MWYWIIKVSILSLIFIFLLHYLYSFFISTLTVPKIKDLVNLPQEKYNEMFQSLQPEPSQKMNNNDLNKNYGNYINNTQSMKEDLIHFLKEIGSSNESVTLSTESSLYNSNINSNKNVNLNKNINPFDSLDSNISSFSFSKQYL